MEIVYRERLKIKGQIIIFFRALFMHMSMSVFLLLPPPMRWITRHIWHRLMTYLKNEECYFRIHHQYHLK